MKKFLLYTMLAVGLLAVAAPLLAQPAPGEYNFIPDTWLPVGLKWLGVGIAVFGVIEGLKNTPFFKAIFDRWPYASILTNALLALAIAWASCLNMPEGGDFGIVQCFLTGLSVFLSAAGAHLVVRKLSPVPREVAGGTENADAPRGAPYRSK